MNVGAGSSSSHLHGSTSVPALPDFASISQKNMRQVFKGKNPKALAKNSEIWYHTKLSNERLSRVAKGHKFWGVISNPATEGSPTGAGGVLGEAAFESTYGDSTYEQPLPLPHDPFQAATAAAKDAAEQAKKLEQLRLQQKFRVLNGMRFDISNQSTVVHYGMSFVLMNTNEEVLAVDRDMKVKIKALPHVKPSDKVLFKLIDLTEVTNPGPVRYGRPMWFQLWDADLSTTVDFVLGSKVAELPSTSAIKLPGLEGIEEQEAREKEANAASSEALNTRAAAVAAVAATEALYPGRGGSAIGAPGTQVASGAPTTDTAGTATPGGSRSRASSARGSRGGGGGGVGLGRGDSGMRASRAPSTRSLSARGDEGEGDGEAAGNGGSVSTSGESRRRSVSTSSAVVRAVAAGSGGAAEPPVAVRKTVVVEECGGLQAVCVIEKAKAPEPGGATVRRNSYGPADGAGADAAGGAGAGAGAATNLRFHTKSSFYLGKWIPRPATIPATKDKLLKTNMPIYMEQDIYCLAASLSNSAISQWPRRFEDFADERVLAELNMGSKKKRADDRREGVSRPGSRGATAGTPAGTPAGVLASGSITVREGRTREGGGGGDPGAGTAGVSFAATSINTMEGSSTPAHTPRASSAASASTPVPTGTPKSRTPQEGSRSRANSGWSGTGAGGAGTGTGTAAGTPRTDLTSPSTSARAGTSGGGGPFFRSRAEILASLPAGAFRPTVPALYGRPTSSGSVDSVGTGANTATLTVDTADSRFAADVDAAAALAAGAGAGTAEATAAVRATLAAQAQQHAATSQLATAGAEGFFGCVRKIVLRGPPYELSVDKRCVWRLCVVEDVSSKNDDDFLAAKVMQRARKALQKSEDFRRGGTEHDTGKAGMVPIKGGEAFSRSLRLDTTATNYQGETLMLHPVRQKEVRPREHFEDIMFGAEFMRAKRAGEVKAREDEARDFGNVFMRTSSQAKAQGVSMFGSMQGGAGAGAGAGAGMGFQAEARLSNVGLGQSQGYGQGLGPGQGQGSVGAPSRHGSRHGSVASGVVPGTGWREGDLSASNTPPQGGGRDRSTRYGSRVSVGGSVGVSASVGGGRDRDDATSVASNVTGLASDAGNTAIATHHSVNTNRSVSQRSAGPGTQRSVGPGVGAGAGTSRSALHTPAAAAASLFCSAATCGALSIAAMEGEDDLDDWERRALGLLSDRPLDVLVVDDSLSERLALCETLRAEGHTAFEAINGQDAVQKYARLHVANRRYFNTSSSSSSSSSSAAMPVRCVLDFDCVVIDLVMPEMDGPSTVAQLRAMGYGGIVLGMVAASGAAAGLEVFKAYGADEVLLKPVALHTFHLAMVGLLAQRLREEDEGAPAASQTGASQRAGLGRAARGPLAGPGVLSSASVASHGSAAFPGGLGAGGSLAAFGASTHSVSLQASGLGRHRPGSLVEGSGGGVDSLKEIFSDCVSFGERVTSLRSVLSDVGARVEDSVRLAFEEQKRREALELTKLKKAGHHLALGVGVVPGMGVVGAVAVGGVGVGVRGVGAVAGADSATATALNSPTAAGASPFHGTATTEAALQRLSISLPHGDSTSSIMPENTAAAREALARERERLTLLRKKMKMEEADEHIQQAMTHKEKIKKYQIAQDFYDNREKVQRRHAGGGSVNAGAGTGTGGGAGH